MTQRPYSIEKGLRITGANSDSPSVDHLFGSGAPGGDTGDQDAAGVGSTYQRTNGELWLKVNTLNTTADWIRVATLADVFALSWRSERVIVATTDAAPSTGTVIDLVATPFGDDEGTQVIAADFVANDYIIFGVGGTETLMRVSLVSGDEITVVTAADPLTDNDTFIVRKYLPDSPDAQEAQAIVTYNGTTLIKISDFNWALADGINLTGGYLGTTNGTPTAGDTVEAAVGKLDANQRDMTTLSGVSQGAVDNGTFTGDIIPDSSTTKAALQALETELVDTRDNVDDLITLSGVAENATDLGTFTGTVIPDNSDVKGALQALESSIEGRTQAAGVTTITTLDSVLVDDVLAAEWEVHMREDATPANVRVEKVLAVHDGTASADAADVDNTIFAKLRLGSVFNADITVDLNGTAGAQTMRLRVASSTAGVTFTAKRVEIR